MAIGFGISCPKPERRKRTKGRKDRQEAKVKKSVRAQCVQRDGDWCRKLVGGVAFVDVGWEGAGSCAGPSQWAHLHSHRRSQTRGQTAIRRHTTAGSLMLCTKHHQQYDAHQLRITALTRAGCNGPLKFRVGKA